MFFSYYAVLSIRGRITCCLSVGLSHGCQKLEVVAEICPLEGAQDFDRSRSLSLGCKTQVVGVCAT